MLTFTIPTAHSIKFHKDFVMLAEQSESLFGDAVRTEPDYLMGKFGYFDRIGSIDPVERTQRLQPTILQTVPHSRRQISLRDFDFNVPIDKQDKRRMIHGDALPGKYMDRIMSGFKRKKDDMILGALFGNSVSVDEDGTATNVVLPSAQITVNGGAGLTYAKILQAKEILIGANVDLQQEPLFGAISEKAFTDLQNLTEFKSVDFNKQPGGEIEGTQFRWRGINWRVTTRLPVASNIRKCAVWARSAVGYALGEDMGAAIKDLPQANYTPNIHGEYAADATRIEDEKVVEIDVDEAA